MTHLIEQFGGGFGHEKSPGVVGLEYLFGTPVLL
jgi:hypothetical protein